MNQFDNNLGNVGNQNGRTSKTDQNMQNANYFQDSDMSNFNNDLIRTDDGKYYYRIEDDRFEVDRFNRQFEQYKQRRKEEMDKILQKKLDELNKPIPDTPIYNQPVGDILVQTKDEMLGILDDLLLYKFTSNTFIKNNRLFFIGILFLFVSIFIFVIFAINKIKYIS